MKRKLKMFWRILKSDDFVCITKKQDKVSFDLSMQDIDIRRYTAFLNQHLDRTNEIQDQIDEILF